MRIAVISDTHSRYATVEKVLEIIDGRAIDRILHCGDLEDADAVRLFKGRNAHFVFGNCDWDKEGIHRAVQEIGATLHEPFGDLELGDRKVAWIHGDDKRLFRDIENSDHFDYLFYGHTHVAEQHRVGKTLVVNPGALHRARPKSFVLLDLHSDALETITLADSQVG